MSQVQRVLDELGIEDIKAHSPQAKGRVERLWGTMQNRLIKEMRKAGITTMEEANAFLPAFIVRFNARFSVDPQDPNSAWEPFGEMDPAYYFSTKEARTVRTDHTVSWNNQTLQIQRTQGQTNLAGKIIHVQVDADSQIHLYHQKQKLDFERLPQKPKPIQKPKGSTTTQPSPERRKRQMAFLHATVNAAYP